MDVAVQPDALPSRFGIASALPAHGERNANSVRATKGHVATYRSWSLARYPADPSDNHDIETLSMDILATRLSLFALEVLPLIYVALLVYPHVLFSTFSIVCNLLALCCAILHLCTLYTLLSVYTYVYTYEP